MFNRIPADVSEIVVVYSRCKDVYLEMKKIVLKFRGESVKERILGKLTIKTKDLYCIECRLSEHGVLSSPRTNDKPYYMALSPFMRSAYVYEWSNFCNRCIMYNAPSIVTKDGGRYYRNHSIKQQNSMSYIYKFGDLMIYESGCRRTLYEYIMNII